MIGRIEKSSDSDSIGESDVSKARSVTGTPSIWKTTQRQRSEMRQTTPTPCSDKRTPPGSIHFMPESYRLASLGVK